MKKTNRMRIGGHSLVVVGVAVCVSILMLASSASASLVVVYQENFGTTTNNLNGRTPTTVSGDFGTTDAVWIASTFFKEDGSVASGSTDPKDRSAFLPFVPETGWVYTLELDLAVSGNWLSLGFSNAADVAFGPNDNNDEAPGTAWMLVRGNGDGAAFGGPGTGDGIHSGSLGVTTTETQRYTIVLDMMNGPGSTNVEFFVNGLSWASAEDKDFSGINYVQLGRRTNTTGQYGNLTLSAIPEPSVPLLLGALGALMLLRRRR